MLNFQEASKITAKQTFKQKYVCIAVPKLLMLNKMLLNSYFTRSGDESVPTLIFMAARFL